MYTLLILGLILGWTLWDYLFPPKTPQTRSYGLSECFYEQPRVPYHPKVETYGSLINCLIKYESGGNPGAIGDAGEKGILQFMPSTYELYCEKNGFSDNIWSVEAQKNCAAEMIDRGLAYHWSTIKYCQN